MEIANAKKPVLGFLIKCDMGRRASHNRSSLLDAQLGGPFSGKYCTKGYCPVFAMLDVGDGVRPGTDEGKNAYRFDLFYCRILAN